jgi:hypothetical protein
MHVLGRRARTCCQHDDVGIKRLCVAAASGLCHDAARQRPPQVRGDSAAVLRWCARQHLLHPPPAQHVDAQRLQPLHEGCEDAVADGPPAPAHVKRSLLRERKVVQRTCVCQSACV